MSQAPAPTEDDIQTQEPVSVQQSDNVAHAISGAGGGLVAMALTFALIRRRLQVLTADELHAAILSLPYPRERRWNRSAHILQHWTL